MGKIGIQTARDLVKAYCVNNHIKQSEFGTMLNLSHSTFQRFMGAGAETTGKGSLAYDAINKFFQAEKRKMKKSQASEAKSSMMMNFDTDGHVVKKQKVEEAPVAQAKEAVVCDLVIIDINSTSQHLSNI